MNALLLALPWRGILLAAAVMAAAGGIYYRGYQSGKDNGAIALAEARADWAEKKAQDEKDAAAYWVAQVLKATDAAQHYQTSVAALTLSARTFKERYDTHAKNTPLPADCRFDAERVRLITDHIRNANAALAAAQSNPGSTVRTDPGSGLPQPGCTGDCLP